MLGKIFESIMGKGKAVGEVKMTEEWKIKWAEVSRLLSEKNKSKQEVARLGRMLEIQKNQFWLMVEESIPSDKYDSLEVDEKRGVIVLNKEED